MKEQGKLANEPEREYPHFFAAMQAFARDEDVFRQAMDKLEFSALATFLFSACKMSSLDILNADSLILEVFCQKVSDLQENG